MYWFHNFFCCKRYLSGKAPGFQSILDLVILDYIKVSITQNVLTVIVTYIGLFHGHIGNNLAQVLIIILVNLGGLELAALQVCLVIKAILIFKPELFQDASDFQVVGCSRIGAFIYTGLRFIIDILPEAKPTILTKLLTGTALKT